MRQELVIVSNRLPFRAVRSGSALTLAKSPGGLVTALEPALRTNGGVWIGWSGLGREEIAAAGGITLPDDPHVEYIDVPISTHEASAYYHGFSNRTLWPLLHYFIGRTEIDASTWRAYERVNERFAVATAEAIGGRRALVWVHDYQLMRVPGALRAHVPDAALGFFLHVPFPAVDVFRVLPWSRELLRGILGADYVGFHTAGYAGHFLDCAEQLLGCAVDRADQTVRFDGRVIGIGVHPASIDVEEADRLAALAGDARALDAPHQIIGVDRLDYTKGIVPRLEALERLFERYPQYRKTVRFTQVLVPSREHVRDYRELKREIDETVGRINGRFSEGGWTPIRYFARSLSREALFAAYRAADVALVTPLRDGMNLIAKEYVMAQADDDGVLVLSELAGVADDFQEAVTVTPFDVDAVADAIHRALSMAPDERRIRMRALRSRVRSHDANAWVGGFVTATRAAVARARVERASPVDAVRRQLTAWLAERATLSLLLDFDGTLAPIVDHPERAAISGRMRAVLEDARRNPRLDVTIVTGRALADIRHRVNIPGLTYVANHGFEVAGPGVSFQHEDAVAFRHAIDDAAHELRELDAPGAHVEPKGATLSYHFRGVPTAERQAVRQSAERVLRKRKLRVTQGKQVIEGRPPGAWDKGAAVLWALAHRHGDDWPSRLRALYIGDDATDEDAFRSLHGLGKSIRVTGEPGDTPTLADLTLPDPDAVFELLRWLASGEFTAAHR